MKSILLTLMIIVWSAPAHAQMFDATSGKIVAPIPQLQCRELSRFDTVFGDKTIADYLIGAYGFGMIDGYAEGRAAEIAVGIATGPPLPKEAIWGAIAQATLIVMRPNDTPMSISILTANMRGYCSMPEHAEHTIRQAFRPFRDQIFRDVKPAPIKD